MINDLNIDCPTIKFVDDITTTEIKTLIGPSQMEGSLVKVSDWLKPNAPLITFQKKIMLSMTWILKMYSYYYFFF